MGNPVTFSLPMPPSVNAIWRGKNKGVYLSPEYKTWRLEAGLILNSQHVPEMAPPYRVEYAFGRPDKRKRDVFNLEKALSDLLESQGVFTNDCEIEDGRVYWDRENKLAQPGMVHCTVESLNDT